MEKAGGKSNRGGARPGSGRPSGLTKIKVSVSIDEVTLKAAVGKWDGKLSPLVEMLLREYVAAAGAEGSPGETAARKST